MEYSVKSILRLRLASDLGVVLTVELISCVMRENKISSPVVLHLIALCAIIDVRSSKYGETTGFLYRFTARSALFSAENNKKEVKNEIIKV